LQLAKSGYNGYRLVAADFQAAITGDPTMCHLGNKRSQLRKSSVLVLG
jgi:hypothetical protein